MIVRTNSGNEIEITNLTLKKSKSGYFTTEKVDHMPILAMLIHEAFGSGRFPYSYFKQEQYDEILKVAGKNGMWLTTYIDDFEID